MHEITEIRLRLRSNGYHPIPCDGKAPKGISGWQNFIDVTPEQIESWERTWPKHTNTGVLTKFTPCLDIDILDPTVASAMIEFVRGWVKTGTLLRRIGLPPKCAFFFRTDQPFKKISVPLVAADPKDKRPHKIEFLGDGQQAVVHGIHPDTNKPYEWPDGQDLCDVPRDQLPSPHGA